MDPLEEAPPSATLTARGEEPAAAQPAPQESAHAPAVRGAEDNPPPGTLGSNAPPPFHLALFGLTFLSAVLAGILLDDRVQTGAPGAIAFFEKLGMARQTATGAASLLPALPRALAFAASLLSILLAHEMGHFLLARRHRVDASWPYFLPAPLVSFIGTLGAVIKLRALPRTREALIDIGAAGPLAGFVVAIPVLAIGLRLSTLQTMSETLHHWTAWHALQEWQRTGAFPALRDGVDLGEPLVLQLLERILFGPLRDDQSIQFHPVAVAGWFGLFVTALNLLPLGQLDGGHLLFSVSPRLHRLLSRPLSLVLVAMGLFTPFIGWLIWGAVTGTLLARHPPLREPQAPIGPARAWVLLASLAVFLLSFSPVPLAMLTP